MNKEKLEVLERAARMLKVMAHPIRMAIVNVLVEEKTQSVGQIQQQLGITQSMTSQHLSLMKRIGVLECKKVANVCNYSIRNKNILKLLRCVENCAQ